MEVTSPHKLLPLNHTAQGELLQGKGRTAGTATGRQVGNAVCPSTLGLSARARGFSSQRSTTARGLVTKRLVNAAREVSSGGASGTAQAGFTSPARLPACSTHATAQRCLRAGSHREGLKRGTNPLSGTCPLLPSPSLIS